MSDDRVVKVERPMPWPPPPPSNVDEVIEQIEDTANAVGGRSIRTYEMLLVMAKEIKELRRSVGELKLLIEHEEKLRVAKKQVAKKPKKKTKTKFKAGDRVQKTKGIVRIPGTIIRCGRTKHFVSFAGGTPVWIKEIDLVYYDNK